MSERITSLRAVLAIAARKRAGKGLVSAILQRHGFDAKSISLGIRADMKASGRYPEVPTTTQLQDHANEVRRVRGGGVWAGELLNVYDEAARTGGGSDLVVVDGVRNPDEFLTMERMLPAGVLIRASVWAPYPLRLERSLDPENYRPGDPRDEQEFSDFDYRDRGHDEPAYGQQTDLCLDMVPDENQLTNTGSKEEVEAQVLALLRRYGLLQS